jgi:hypothetical protein
MWRVHRLDQINAKKPANLFDFYVAYAEILEQTDWPVFFTFPVNLAATAQVKVVGA